MPRPRKFIEPSVVVCVRVPQSVAASMDATTTDRGAYVTEALIEKLTRKETTE